MERVSGKMKAILGSSVLVGLTFVSTQNFTSVESSIPAEYEKIRSRWSTPPTASSLCSPKSAPIVFGEMKGVKTLNEKIKPTTDEYSKITNTPISEIEDDRHPAVFTEIQPMLYNKTVVEYLNKLIEAGVNTGEIRIDTRDLYGKMLEDGQEQISKSEWQKYGWSLYAENRNETQIERLKSFREKVIKNSFTPTQQAMQIVEFLKQVSLSQASLLPVSYSDEKISKNFKFMIAELAWFGDSDTGALYNETKVRELIEERASKMAFIINGAQHECVDHFLAGVFFFEPSTTNIQGLLNVHAELAKAINQKTGGWLKRQGALLASGGGWGANYSGLQAMMNQNLAQPFFEKMKAQTGSYALAFKAMQYNNKGFLVGDMVKVICDKYSLTDDICKCPVTDVTCRNKIQDAFTSQTQKWKEYFVEIGFNELKSFINTNRDNYPKHANVVFVGDSSDGLMGLTEDSSGNVTLDASITALGQLFTDAGLEKTNNEGRVSNSWRGKTFMEAYDTVEVADGTKPARVGKSFFHLGNYNFKIEETFTGTVNIIQHQKSFDVWTKWPRL